jgi:hypothetical protein
LRAEAASQALLDQVSIDGSAGNFDTSGFVGSCTIAEAFCQVFTSVRFAIPTISTIVITSFADNGAVEAQAHVQPSNIGINDAILNFQTWAAWSIVPEPATLFFIGAGMLSIIAFTAKRVLSESN